MTRQGFIATKVSGALGRLAQHVEAAKKHSSVLGTVSVRENVCPIAEVMSKIPNV